MIKKKLFERKKNKTALKYSRLIKLNRHWTVTKPVDIDSVKIFGRNIEEQNRPAMSFVRRVFGLSKSHTIPFFINMQYGAYVRANMVKLKHWYVVKRIVEHKKMIGKRLKKLIVMQLKSKVNQGNLYANKFWRGLPVRGQSARSNGQNSRKLNKDRMPISMHINPNAVFLKVNTRIESNVLSKKLSVPKQGVSEKGQYARVKKKK